MAGERILVIGAGIAGLFTALALAKEGRDLTLIDKDRVIGREFVPELGVGTAEDLNCPGFPLLLWLANLTPLVHEVAE